MAVTKVVNASLDENGHISGGQPGDQTGQEVRVQNWYSRPWDHMIRWPNQAQATQAANVAAQLANSNLVGYNQDRRNTLYNKLRDYGWNVNAYIASGDLTEVDCSSFVFACYAYVLPAIRYNGNAPTTADMVSVYSSWGFQVYTNSIYLTSPDYLNDGDILLYENHHTVIAYEPGYVPPQPGDLIIGKKNICATLGADSFDKTLAGKYKVQADLYIRNGPGVLYKALGIMPEGATVYNYGYYTKRLGKKWLYVEYHTPRAIYTGFASEKYLSKISALK